MRYNDENWPWGTEPFYPVQVIRHAIVVSVMLTIFLGCVFFIPWIFIHADKPADPLQTPLHIKPEWYFLAAYQTLKLISTQCFGPWAKSLGILIPLLSAAAVTALPFLDRSPERDIRKRPFLFFGSIVFIAIVAAMTLWGMYS